MVSAYPTTGGSWGVKERMPRPEKPSFRRRTPKVSMALATVHVS